MSTTSLERHGLIRHSLAEDLVAKRFAPDAKDEMDMLVREIRQSPGP